ncbi:protein O-mannosyl-transferase TMTC2-like isoform X2 [Rhopilema esculentum]
MDLRTPNFYNSDNPTANHEEFKVRVLTFIYLPVLNFYLLLFPWQLSFDWSMDAVPLIISFYDKRNIESILFYSALGALTYRFVGSMSSCSTFRLKSLTCAIDSPSANEIKWAKETNLKQAKPCSFTSMINLKFNCMYGSDSDLISENSGSVFQKNSSKNHSYPILFDHSHSKKTSTAPNNNCSNNEFNKGSSADLAFNRRMTKTDCKRTRGAAEFCSAKVNEDASLLNPQPHDIDEQCSNHGFDVAIFSIGITVISFLPASNLFFYVGFVIAERVLYIPSIGFCLLFSVGFGHVLSASLKFRPFLKGVVLCFLCLLMLRTILRNEDWRDEEALYRSGLHINPAKAWSNLGIILSNKGRFKAAEEAYRNALAARPNMADTHYNLGILLQNMRRYDESIRSYKNAIVFRPSLASAHLNLGLVFDEIGLKQQALEILENAKNLSDHGLKNPKAHQHSLTSIKYNIGKILFDLGKHKESVRVFHEAIDDMPDSFAPHSLYNMLGQSYSFLGNNERAEEWYLKSLRVNETHVPAHLTYARHLALTGNARAAEQWYSKALQLSPDNSDAHYHFAEFLLKSGRKVEGFAKLDRAVELKPDQEDLLSFAATSFREAGVYDKAELFYRKAILVNPKNPVHHMNLGALLHLTGRLDEAEVSYLEADRLNPNDALTLTNLRKL